MLAARLLLTDYLDGAMASARIEVLGDGTFVGRIEGWIGLLSYADSEAEAIENLRVTLEEWVLICLRSGEELPVYAGIDLNREPVLEPLDAL